MKKLTVGKLPVLAVIIGVVLVAVLVLLVKKVGESKVRMVGQDIPMEKVTEFYYTKAASTFPPYYQRYQLSVKEGKHLFYHETREGDSWPLREEHITHSGTVELTPEQWAEFAALLEGGAVVMRTDSVNSGSSGPDLYLYWTGDKGKYQEFSFASIQKEDAFEALCAALANES